MTPCDIGTRPWWNTSNAPGDGRAVPRNPRVSSRRRPRGIWKKCKSCWNLVMLVSIKVIMIDERRCTWRTYYFSWPCNETTTYGFVLTVHPLPCSLVLHARTHARTHAHSAGEGRVAVVEFLCQAGADVNVRDRWGNRPLDDAKASKHDACCQILEKYGAKNGAAAMATTTMTWPCSSWGI